MDIIPVLDLMQGIVVRGVAGRRDEYRAVESRLASDPKPLTVARAFRERLGLNRLYLADLDGIQHGRPRYDVYRELSAEGFELLIDAGLRDVREAEALMQSGVQAVIAGLETSEGPEQLRKLCIRVGAERLIFSLDLANGRVLKQSNNWENDDALGIARVAVNAGVRRMIVLDLAGVGMGQGVATADLCIQLRAEFPELYLITGGGVRGIADLEMLRTKGVDGVLLASTLHDGTIGRDEIQSLRSNVSG